MTPLRFCFLAAADSIHSYRWVKFFAERGHRVDWLSFASLAFDPIRGVRFRALTAGPWKDRTLRTLHALIAARRAIRRIEFDVFHAHYVGLNGVTAALCRVRPLVLTAWGSDILVAGRSRLAGPFVRMALRSADLITCDAEHMIRTMVAMGIPRERIRRINFGTDVERFTPRPRPESLALALRIVGAPCVISVRSLYPVYDVATLIRAIPAVLERVPNALFLIGGHGPEEPALRVLAESLGLQDRIRFCGLIRNEELPDYFAAADVYVSTALSDAGLASSTQEAMACGLPVVITESGENGLWVRDGVNGYLVPTRDPAALAARIVSLLEDAGARGRFGRANRDLIVEQDNFVVEMEKMDRLYREVSAGRAPAVSLESSLL